MTRKKIIIMGLICTFLMWIITGCGINTNKNKAEKSQDLVQKQEANDEKINKTKGEIGKVLVVYYSATGSTEAVASIIAETMAADVFQLKPIEPYSDADLDWRDKNSRVTKEHDDPNSRNVELATTTVENWDSYDTVFIGYPIWWGIAAWPVDKFVKGNDFTGKIVIPFCTSTSSGIGDSGELLEKMAGTGSWLEGERFRSGASTTDVQKWTENLKK